MPNSGWGTETHNDFGEGILQNISQTNPDYPKGYLWDANNIVYTRDSDEPEKMMGYSLLGTTTLGSSATGLFDYAEGTRLIATTQLGAVKEYAGTDWAASTGGSGFSTAGERWSGCMFYGATSVATILVLCNGTDAPQKYTSGAGVSALGGSPPATGKYPVPFVGRLFMAAGDSIYWSKVGDCETWAPADGGNARVDGGEGGNITGMAVYMGTLLIFKRNRLYRIQPSATLAAAAIERLSSSTGTVSHHTIQEVTKTQSAGLSYLSDHGVAAISPTISTGGFSVAPISNNVQSILETRYKADQTWSWAVFSPDRGEYWLQYGQNGSVPQVGIIGNVARERRPIRWTRHDLLGVTCGCNYLLSGRQIMAFGTSTGLVYRMNSTHARNGAAFRGRVVTPSYTQGYPGYMKRYGRVFVDCATNGSYSVNVNLNMGRANIPGSATNAGLLAAGINDGWGVGEWGEAFWGGAEQSGVYFRPNSVARGSYLMFRLETIGTNQWFRLNGITIEAEVTASAIAA